MNNIYMVYQISNEIIFLAELFFFVFLGILLFSKSFNELTDMTESFSVVDLFS